MEYTVLIHPAEEGGFWAEVPELPGCYSQGDTIQDALSNSRGDRGAPHGIEGGIGGGSSISLEEFLEEL